MERDQSYQRLLELRGIPLSGIGLREVALERADALHALELLKAQGIGIFGGDVYLREKLKIVSAMADWHSEPRPGESRKEFVERSYQEAKSYIARLPASEAILIVLVPDTG